MKEILFRGKRIDNNEWVEGYYVKMYDAHHNRTTYGICTGYLESDWEELFLDWHKVAPLSVGIFTGRTDKNDKKVFEGDILYVKFKVSDSKTLTYVGVVKYEDDKGVFICENAERCDGLYVFGSDDYEVIGNIFDNSKLMED